MNDPEETRRRVAALAIERGPGPRPRKPAHGLRVGIVAGAFVSVLASVSLPGLAPTRWPERTDAARRAADPASAASPGAGHLRARGPSGAALAGAEGPRRADGPSTLPEVALTASGFVVPAAGVLEVGPRSSGRIEEVLVEAGQRVEAGELLVRLDDRAARAAVAQARARLASARAEATMARSRRTRARRLRDAGILALEEWERERNRAILAEAQVRELEAALARHLLELEFTELRAPRAGTVLEVRREVGENVTFGPFEGSPWLVEMADLGDLRVVVDVHEEDLERVALGQAAAVTPDAIPGRSYPARVVAIGPRSDRQKGTVPVEVSIDEPDGHLRPDAGARVRFPDAAGRSVRSDH